MKECFEKEWNSRDSGEMEVVESWRWYMPDRNASLCFVKTFSTKTIIWVVIILLYHYCWSKHERMELERTEIRRWWRDDFWCESADFYASDLLGQKRSFGEVIIYTNRSYRYIKDPTNQTEALARDQIKTIYEGGRQPFLDPIPYRIGFAFGLLVHPVLFFLPFLCFYDRALARLCASLWWELDKPTN